MPRVLFVEDISDVARLLAELIANRFPGWEIETAASVAEASSIIRKECPDYVILDYKLLDAPMGDLDLCRLIRARCRSTSVIHVSAWADNEALKTHMQDVHLGDEESEPIAKELGADSTWMGDVVRRLQSLNVTNRIRAKLDALFGPPERDPIGAPREGVTFRGSATNRIADLCDDARINWSCLSLRLQADIRAHVCVDESDPDEVRISLHRMPDAGILE
jgi:CheY-like chemotaxis protein